MSTLSLQPVTTPNGIQQVADLAKQIWNQHFPPIIGQEQVDYMVEKFQSPPAITQQIENGYHYDLLIVNKEAIGYTSILPQDNHRLFLSKLYITESHRGQGHARQALQQIQTRYHPQGYTTLHLTCNKHNIATIAAYERMGFRHTGTTIIDIGQGYFMDDVTMERAITA